MAAPSKSQTAKNVVLALLALWSVVSLIIIVVWATSPDLKSSARCRAELLEVTEKLEGAKVVYGKNKVALEELLEKTGEQRDALRADLLVMGGRLDATNATLEECRLENVVLNWNISALQEKVELLRQTETNLTAQIVLQEGKGTLALSENLHHCHERRLFSSSLRAFGVFLAAFSLPCYHENR
ncbi:uncharacterized protein [Pseudochaenichthys georgianus]|uniref:uncharacterized protein n=1 Tax=Pseudochaenichthys georgianus TaxID=52239 RepID=UPI00146F669F|nr:uncharacterized protein si:ch211-1a19.3 [Pseudochaenichthys georgianus]